MNIQRQQHGVVAALALVLAACASGGPKLSDQQKLALYEAHAGAPVNKFSYFGSGGMLSWTPLGNQAVAIWTRPNEAWLLNLSGPCPDLPFTPAIGLTSTMQQVSVRFDSVIVRGTNTMSIPCQIAQIRPLDVKAIKQAEKTARESLDQQRQSQ